jgi:hypothetical protein
MGNSEAAPTTPATVAPVFSQTNAASVVRNTQAARVILRTVVLALEAVEDGSIQIKDGNNSSRWSAAISEASSRLEMVRDELMETRNPPPLDWVTPLTLVEALDAALWHGYAVDDERLTNHEVVYAAKVVIESLDALLQECEVSKPAAVSPVH